MPRIAMLLAFAALIAAPSPGLADVKAKNLFNTGCKVAKSPAHGCFLTDVKGPIAAGPLGRGSKQGKACGWNLLALVTMGDVRITTAMKNGGVTQVSAVDTEVFELVPGFYGFSTYCTVVHGE